MVAFDKRANKLKLLRRRNEISTSSQMNELAVLQMPTDYSTLALSEVCLISCCNEVNCGICANNLKDAKSSVVPEISSCHIIANTIYFIYFVYRFYYSKYVEYQHILCNIEVR